MIKKLLIFSTLAGLILTSCADEDLKPIATFEDSAIGIQAALIEGGAIELDLANPSASVITNTVMLRGDEAASYVIYMSYDDRNPENGDNSKPEITFLEFGQSDFQTVAESPYPRVTYSIAFTDLIRDFGLDQADLRAGDRFRLRSEIISVDGRVFGNANSAAAVQGPAFAGAFDFNLLVTCPLPDDKFAGTYAISYEGDATAGFGLPFAETTVSVSPLSSTRRGFRTAWAPGIGGFDIGTLSFVIVCDVALWESKNTGLACSSGSITLVPGPAAPIISLTDDSVVKLNIIEYQDDGGCGINPSPKTIVLTKQ